MTTSNDPIEAHDRSEPSTSPLNSQCPTCDSPAPHLMLTTNEQRAANWHCPDPFHGHIPAPEAGERKASGLCSAHQYPNAGERDYDPSCGTCWNFAPTAQNDSQPKACTCLHDEDGRINNPRCPIHGQAAEAGSDMSFANMSAKQSLAYAIQHNFTIQMDNLTVELDEANDLIKLRPRETTSAKPNDSQELSPPAGRKPPIPGPGMPLEKMGRYYTPDELAERDAAHDEQRRVRLLTTLGFHRDTMSDEAVKAFQQAMNAEYAAGEKQ